MKSLNNYIFESQEIITTSNKQRRKELERWLKHKKYDDYVETLNKMLEDPKSAALLKDGFGGDLGDTKLKFSVEEIPVTQLMPTQQEIDLNKSIKHPLQEPESLKDTFTNPILLKWPIVTFRKNYIIDGHHTWLQAAIFNPNGKILAFNYDGDISPIQMLKAVQGTIAAVRAEDKDGKLPSCTTTGPNLFDENFTQTKIRKYIKESLDKNLIDIFHEYINKCVDFNSTIDFITERMIDIKTNNYPLENAPSRDDMPQVFKGGKDENDKKTSLPDKEGSAMNKLKNDKFMKSIIK